MRGRLVMLAVHGGDLGRRSAPVRNQALIYSTRSRGQCQPAAAHPATAAASSGASASTAAASCCEPSVRRWRASARYHRPAVQLRWQCRHLQLRQPGDVRRLNAPTASRIAGLAMWRKQPSAVGFTIPVMSSPTCRQFRARLLRRGAGVTDPRSRPASLPPAVSRIASCSIANLAANGSALSCGNASPATSCNVRSATAASHSTASPGPYLSADLARSAARRAAGRRRRRRAGTVCIPPCTSAARRVNAAPLRFAAPRGGHSTAVCQPVGQVRGLGLLGVLAFISAAFRVAETLP